MPLDRPEWPPGTVHVHWHPLYCDLKPRRPTPRFRAKIFRKSRRDVALRCPVSAARRPILENEHRVADTDQIFQARNIPIGQSDAAVTCGAADCFRIVRAVNANAGLVQTHPEDADEILRPWRQIVIIIRTHAVIEHAFIVAKPGPDGCAENFPRTDGRW